VLLLLATLGPNALLGRQVDAQAASLEELAARVTPAVVLIDVQTAAESRQGSGFLVASDGIIFTNYHVIRDARTARVRMSSGDVYEEVRVLAGDPRRDIAIIQIAGFDLPYLEMGNSDSVRVGAQVVLVGSPLGLENTVSTGIVSGRRQEPAGYQLLQISAPASRGSSGGAVIGVTGEVLAIASSQIGGGQNLNFAVPINYARGLLSHLDDEPLAVLRPTNLSTEADPTPAPRSGAVNEGLAYRVDEFEGLRMELSSDLDGNRRRQTRITYRVIETVAASAPRIERYMESETVRITEPFGTIQTLDRERSRVVVRSSDLRPISARGEASHWNGTDWVSAGYDLLFEDYRVTGLVTDSAGRAVDLDRQLPEGIIVESIRDLAFALLDSDDLIGRSVEFTTFDPRTAKVDRERYDILRRESLRMNGREENVLRVNMARGLDNEILFVRADQPRIVLRRISGDGAEVENVSDLQMGAPLP
jgi:hypothetical protein